MFLPLSDKSNHLSSDQHKNKTKQQHIRCEDCVKIYLMIQDISKVKFTKPRRSAHSFAHICVRSSTWWVRTRNRHKVGRTHFSLGGTCPKTLTLILIILIGMHLWDLNTKSFRRFSAIKKTY